MRNATIKRFAKLLREKRHLEEKLDVLKKKIADAMPGVLGQFVAAGMTNCTVDKTPLYLKRAIYAKLPTKKVFGAHLAFLAALRDSPYADYISESVNVNSISRLLRDLETEAGMSFRDCEKLSDLEIHPDQLHTLGDLASHIGVSEVYTVTDRKPTEE